MRPTINKEKAIKDAAELEKHKAAFFRKGGKVTQLPPLEFTYRLCTVKGGGSNGDLILYASKYDALMGRQDKVKVKRGELLSV